MKNKAQPLVSVIIPVYNAADYLVEAIDSILAQTYQNLELIIVDDASTDDSWKIISKYKKRYPKLIKAIRLKQNLNKGGDACANLGFQKAKGAYIARMDADDVALPHRLEKQVEFMGSHPEVLICGTQAHVINQTGKIIGDKIVSTDHEQIYQDFFVFNPLIHPTIIIRKSALGKRKNLYLIKYSANNDLLTFFNMLKKGKFANLPDKLLYYRVHGKNDSLIKPKERFFNTLKIRLNAVKAGYKPSLKSIIITTTQALAILLLPEKLIVPVYLYMKGITKPEFSIQTNKPSLPAWAKFKNYVYSLL